MKNIMKITTTCLKIKSLPHNFHNWDSSIKLLKLIIIIINHLAKIKQNVKWCTNNMSLQIRPCHISNSDVVFGFGRCQRICPSMRVFIMSIVENEISPIYILFHPTWTTNATYPTRLPNKINLNQALFNYSHLINNCTSIQNGRFSC